MPGRPATDKCPAPPKPHHPPPAPPPPKPTSNRPTLSYLLQKTAFIIKCMQHSLTIRGIPSRTDYLKDKLKTLRSHKYINDLGMLETDVNKHWSKLESAMGRVEREGFGMQSLSDLGRVLVDFGGGKGMRVGLEMNNRGVLEVVL